LQKKPLRRFFQGHFHFSMLIRPCGPRSVARIANNTIQLFTKQRFSGCCCRRQMAKVQGDTKKTVITKNRI